CDSLRPRPCPTLFPYTTLFRSLIVFRQPDPTGLDAELHPVDPPPPEAEQVVTLRQPQGGATLPYAMLDSGELQLGAVYQRLQDSDRKSTRLNSSHVKISYAVFC